MHNQQHENITLNPRVRFRAVGDDGVIVQMDSGRVIVVNEVGLFLTSLLKKTVHRDDLITALVKEFEVSSGQAASDLEVFLDQLNEEQVFGQAA